MNRGRIATAAGVAPFVPTDIAGLVVWFDMQDATSFTDTGGFVSAITNKASSVSWTEATNRPAYAATGLNSRPCMDFDGLNDRIISTEAAVFGALDDQSDYTILGVIAADDLDALEVFFGVADSTVALNNSKRWGTNITGAGVWVIAGNNNAGGGTVAESTGNTVNTPIVFEAYSAATLTSIQINGAAADPNATAMAFGTLTPNRSALGCRPSSAPTTFWDGRIGELLIYSSALSASDRSRARSYLGSRWGITVA